MSEKKRIIDSNQKLSLQAAVIIQCWYRKCKARLEVRRKCAWQVNQSLEYVTDESDPEGPPKSFSLIENLHLHAISIRTLTTYISQFLKRILSPFLTG
uniref:SJCHGC04465 protein n=1 Tax=Schistosoma japonicum TaxID=6182 RepID=Q5BSF8_SCHJA|nr:SJCHGC04465 protein [Schistosoma japonicum]